jgi:hypothetical protein
MFGYLSFLKCCLKFDEELAGTIKVRDGSVALLTFAKKQAIAGVYWQGIQNLGQGEDNPLSEDEVLDWVSEYERIAKRNKFVYKKVAWVSRNFEHEGFKTCVLKGQGNALMYPDKMARVSGDIDVWLWPGHAEGEALEKLTIGQRRKRILDYVRKFDKKASMRYHHVDFDIIKDVPVELHFFPISMNNPWANRRLQRWFDEQAAAQFAHQVEFMLPVEGALNEVAPNGSEGESVVFNSPTNGFNLIYQMLHILHHFFDEGIGLRQLIDYYYLLQQDLTSKEKVDAVRMFQRLHVLDFARAVMYVEQEILGLDRNYLLLEPDEKRGKVLMEEIIQGGNFGKDFTFSHARTGRKYFAKIARNIRLVSMCPSEALWEPGFRTWHFFWRMYARTL